MNISGKAIGRVKLSRATGVDRGPELEAKHCLPVFRHCDLKSKFVKGGIGIDLAFKGVTFCADVLRKNGRPVKYVVGVAYYLKQTPELMELLGKAVKVGIRMPDRLELKYLQRLRKRLVDKAFAGRILLSGSVAIVEIREVPIEVGDLEAAYKQVLSEAPIAIANILSASAGEKDKIKPYGLEVLFAP